MSVTGVGKKGGGRRHEQGAKPTAIRMDTGTLCRQAGWVNAGVSDRVRAPQGTRTARAGGGGRRRKVCMPGMIRGGGMRGQGEGRGGEGAEERSGAWPMGRMAWPQVQAELLAGRAPALL